MDVWVDLKLNKHISIQCVINYGVISHMSVLCHVLIDSMRLVLEKGTLTAVKKPHKELMVQFVSAKVDIDAITINIISDNLLIKVHPKIITCNQSIENIKGRKSYKSIPKMVWLPIPFRCCHNFATKENGCHIFFGKKNVI